MTQHLNPPRSEYVVSSRRFDGADPVQPKYDGWIAVLFWIASGVLPGLIIAGFMWSATL